MALFATSAWADYTWDFTSMSDADKTAYDADTDNWQWDSSNNRYTNKFNPASNTWTAVISTSITQIKDMKFMRSGSSLSAGSFRICKNSSGKQDGKVLYGNSNIALSIPAEKDDTIFINFSNTKSSATGYVLTNAKRIRDNATTITAAQNANQKDTLIVTANGRVEFKCNDSKVVLYKITLKNPVPECVTTITSQPQGTSIAVNEDNPTLSIEATNATSYAWKESSNGTLYDGVSTLSTEVNYTPDINDAVQTKYYYCEVTSSCDGAAVIKSNIVTINVVAEIIHVTGVSLDITSQKFTLGSTTTTTLTATVAPSNADNKNISWTSSEPTIVSVTDNGDGTAEIKALAEGSSTITVTTADGSYTATCVVTVKPNPCASYFWFFSEADQTTNGKTNATAIFSNMVSGGSNQSGSLTVDGTTYNFTRRTGDPSTAFGSFSIPEHKVGTFYAAAISSGDGTRQLVLTETTSEETYQRDVEGPNTTWRSVEIPDLPAGTYTISKAGGNMRIGMIVLKLCDLYWTISFDSDGGSEVANIEVLDGTTAIQPANPTKAAMYFAGWYNGENKYDWSTVVTSNLSLTAHWSDTPTGIENQESKIDNRKFIKDGQLFIEKNGHVYNVFGARVK